METACSCIFKISLLKNVQPFCTPLHFRRGGASSLKVQGSSADPRPYFSKNLKIRHFMITVPKTDSVLTGKALTQAGNLHTQNIRKAWHGWFMDLYGCQKHAKCWLTCKKVAQYTEEHKGQSSNMTKHIKHITKGSLCIFPERSFVGTQHRWLLCFGKTN